MKKTVTTAIRLDTRTPKKDGTYPVKLRITWNRKQKYYGTAIDLCEKDFEEVMRKRVKKQFSKTRDRLDEILVDAKKTVENIQRNSPFTFAQFEKEFFSNEGDTNNIFTAIEAYINSLKEEGQAGTVSTYKSAKHSFAEFSRKKNLTFSDITPEFLNKYEKAMVEAGKSLTTVSIYTRAIRTIFNQAIQTGKVDANLYPFGKYKYQVPAGRNVKKALTMEEITRIFNFEVIPGSPEARAKDMWLFSYLCNGVNMKDIARLKYRNLEGDKLTFIRAKTERTSKRNLKTVQVILLPMAQDIIERWGQPADSAETYIFPILEEGIDAERERALVKQFTKTTNKYMKRIAKAIGITKPVTTYTARHSYATILKRSGAPIAFISDSLGHNSLKTTQNYLGSFEDETKRQWGQALLPK